MQSRPAGPGPDGAMSRRSLLKLAGVGALGFGALSLTGCGRNPADPAGSDTSTVFTSWTLGNENQAPQLTAMLDEFAAANSVSVGTMNYPYHQYLDQIVLKARSGKLSGVLHLDEEWLSTLATAGVLRTVASLYDASLYPDVVDDSGVYRGRRLSMPWAYSGIGLVSNGELLAEAGVGGQELTTREGFYRALKKIKALDPSIVPYAPSTHVQQIKDIIPWMWAFGGTIVRNGTVTLGDEGSLETLDYWKRLLDEGLIQAGMLREDARTLFGQGRAAIYDDAPQAIRVIPDQSPDAGIEAKMAPVPRPGGLCLAWSQPLVVLDDSPASAALAQYLSTDEGALQTAFEVIGQPPALSSASARPWITGNAFLQRWNEMVLPQARTNPLWTFPAATAAQTRFNEEVEAALAGVKSASSAMRTAREDLQTMLTI